MYECIYLNTINQEPVNSMILALIENILQVSPNNTTNILTIVATRLT